MSPSPPSTPRATKVSKALRNWLAALAALATVVLTSVTLWPNPPAPSPCSVVVTDDHGVGQIVLLAGEIDGRRVDCRTDSGGRETLDARLRGTVIDVCREEVAPDGSVRMRTLTKVRVPKHGPLDIVLPGTD